MQRVFITGASTGIGHALAQAYAQQGACLGLLARREDLLQTLRASLPNPERHHIYPLDVRNTAGIRDAAEDFLARAGGIDIVIANAGVSQGMLTEHAEDLAVFEQIMAVNVCAMAATFSPFIAAMQAQVEKSQASRATSGLRLVGISSVAGVRGLPGSAAYSASKAAVTAYCESLRVEMREKGIKVVTIAPGFVATPMTARNPFNMPFLLTPEEFARRSLKCIARGDSYRVIPWQMGCLASLLRIMPNFLYDFVMSKAPKKPRQA